MRTNLDSPMIVAAHAGSRQPISQIVLEKYRLEFQEDKISSDPTLLNTMLADGIGLGTRVIRFDGSYVVAGDHVLRYNVATSDDCGADWDSWTTVAGTTVLANSRPRLWTDLTNKVQVVWIDKNKNINHMASGDGGATWGAVVDSGLNATSNYAVAARSGETDMWLLESINMGTDSWRLQLTRWEYNAGWGSPQLLWIDDMIKRDFDDVIQFDVQSFTPQVGIPPDVIITVPTHMEGRTGFVTWRNGILSPVQQLFALDEMEADNCSIVGGSLNMIGGYIFVTAMGYQGDSNKQNGQMMDLYWYTLDGDYWTGPYIVRKAQTGGQPIHGVLALKGYYIYYVSPKSMWRSPATSFIGVSNSSVTLDVTDKVISWSLSLPRSAAGQGKVSLGNGDGSLDSHAALCRGGRVTRSFGYMGANGTEYTTQISQESIDEISWDYETAQHTVNITSRDNLKFPQVYSFPHDVDLLSQEDMRYDFLDSSGYALRMGTMISQTATASGVGLWNDMTSLNEEGRALTTGLSGLGQIWNGVCRATFVRNAVPAVPGILFRFRQEPLDADGEQNIIGIGYGILIQDNKNDTGTIYVWKYNTDGTITEVDHSNTPITWTNGTKVHLMIVVHGRWLWAYYSVDGLDDFVPVFDANPENNAIYLADAINGNIGITMSYQGEIMTLGSMLPSNSDIVNVFNDGKADSLPNSGTLIIDEEIIPYTTKSLSSDLFDQFGGCTRGASKVSHDVNAMVRQYAPYTCRCEEILAGTAAEDQSIEDFSRWLITRSGGIVEFEDSFLMTPGSLSQFGTPQGTWSAGINGSGGLLVVNGDVYGDVIADLTIVLPASTKAGVALRFSDYNTLGAASGYLLGLTTTTASLSYYAAGVITVIAISPFPFTLTSGVEIPIRISVKGQFFSIWANGRLLGHFYDPNNLRTQGYIGLYVESTQASFTAFRIAELYERIDGLQVDSGQTAEAALGNLFGGRMIRTVAGYDGKINVGLMESHPYDSIAGYSSELVTLSRVISDREWASWARVSGADSWANYVSETYASLFGLRFININQPTLLNTKAAINWAQKLLLEAAQNAIQTNFLVPINPALEREDRILVDNPRESDVAVYYIINDINYNYTVGEQPVADMTIGARNYLIRSEVGIY